MEASIRFATVSRARDSFIRAANELGYVCQLPDELDQKDFERALQRRENLDPKDHPILPAYVIGSQTSPRPSDFFAKQSEIARARVDLTRLCEKSICESQYLGSGFFHYQPTPGDVVARMLAQNVNTIQFVDVFSQHKLVIPFYWRVTPRSA